uniref:Uncharacterized protein n=1 Tax=Pavo cristatus TaxID=9049 RepID=A0A8C9FFN8_PAVCR
MIYHGSCNTDLVIGDLHIISPATPALVQCLLEKSYTGSVKRKNNFSDELSLNSRVQQDCVPAVSPDSTQSLVSYSSKGEMQENDLFKAEFILITDSGDEDEAGTASINAQWPSNGYGPISAQLLATSHVSPGMESRKPPSDGHLPSATLSHSTFERVYMPNAQIFPLTPTGFYRLKVQFFISTLQRKYWLL